MPQGSNVSFVTTSDYEPVIELAYSMGISTGMWRRFATGV
jgi:hypothetical protein